VPLVRPTHSTTQPPRSSIELHPPHNAAERLAAAAGSASGAKFSFPEPASSRSGRWPLKSFAFIVLLGAALFLYSLRHDLLLGQFAAMILTLGALHGLWRGGTRKIIMIAATIGLLYLATSSSDAANTYIQSRMSPSAASWSWVVIAGVLVLALLVIGISVSIFRRRVVMKHPFLRGFDRLVGVGVGTAEGALIILTVCWMAVSIRPYATVVRDQPQTQVGSSRHRMLTDMVRIADEAGDGTVGEIVDATNPIDSVPVLKQAIDDLNTKGEIRLDSLGNLDPETARKLNEWLKQNPTENLGGLNKVIEDYKKGGETQEKSNRQLPPPGGRQ
jgi:uncharacterized membrane protein required for colicin V production